MLLHRFVTRLVFSHCVCHMSVPIISYLSQQLFHWRYMAPFLPPLTPYLKKTPSTCTKYFNFTSLNPCPYEPTRPISSAYWFLNVSRDNVLWVLTTTHADHFKYWNDNLVEKQGTTLTCILLNHTKPL